MNCEQMTALLSAYVDGELTAQEALQVQNHLEQCPECRALLEQLQTLHTSFSDLEEIPAPEHFAQRVMDRIKTEEKSNAKVIPLFSRPQFRAVMGMAACAVLCIGIGSVALNGGYGRSKSAAAPSAAAPAPESAAIDTAEYGVQQSAGGMQEARMEESPMEYAAPEAPAAPAPEGTVTAKGGATEVAEPVMTPAELETDVAPYAPEDLRGEIALSLLPEEVEAVTGPLQWEERREDGALCALLSPNEAEKVMELAYKQGVPLEIGQPAGGEPEVWTLILIP